MEILVYKKNKKIPNKIKQKIFYFLKKYIPAGTVIMDPSVYDSADYTVLVVADDEVLGFSAQKIFNCQDHILVQVMGTFFDERIRGKGFASLLVQCKVFLDIRIFHPFKKIYWCTRTRMPEAYAAAARHDIYPKMNSPELNAKNCVFASKIAKTVYGKQVEINPNNYIMYNSYPESSSFIPPEKKKYKRKSGQWFADNIDYSKNQTLLVFGQFTYTMLYNYLKVLYQFKRNNFIKKKELQWDICCIDKPVEHIHKVTN
jgi:hypothetical protein